MRIRHEDDNGDDPILTELLRLLDTEGLDVLTLSTAKSTGELVQTALYPYQLPSVLTRTQLCWKHFMSTVTRYYVGQYFEWDDSDNDAMARREYDTLALFYRVLTTTRGLVRVVPIGLIPAQGNFCFLCRDMARARAKAAHYNPITPIVRKETPQEDWRNKPYKKR